MRGAHERALRDDPGRHRPRAVDPNELGLLEDLVRAAINQATRRVAEQLRSNLSGMVSGFGVDLSALGLD